MSVSMLLWKCKCTHDRTRMDLMNARLDSGSMVMQSCLRLTVGVLMSPRPRPTTLSPGYSKIVSPVEDTW
jgi:hypothetical protein